MLPSPSGSSNMSDVRVSVVLTPLSVGHNLPRTFTLSDDNPEFEIGRSSKRDVRNRSPASDNGWFDSGVMSRKHAMFSICPQKKNIYICDSGSTHGTWLNNVRLLEYEPTPLICGDVLRFGITVDRGHDVVAPLTVACKIDWLNNTDYESGVPETIPSARAAELETSVNPKPLSSLRPLSTNTFCVPDDSEVEELPNPNVGLPDEAVEGFQAAALKASQEAFSRASADGNQDDNTPQDTSQTSQVQQPDCIIIEQPEEQMDGYLDEDSDEDSDDFLDSDKEESDLEPSALPSSHSSSFNYADNGIEAKFHREEMSVELSDDDSDFSGSEIESDDESAASSHEKPLENDYIDFINPDVLMQNNTSHTTSFDQAPKVVPENSASSTAPVTTGAPKLNTEKPGTVHVEVCGGVQRPHPHSVITAEELPQSIPTLESNQHSVYQDGPFSCISTTAQEETTTEGPVVKLPAWPLKRKLSEMETQDAQIVDSALPATQADLDSLPNPEVVDAISSALSESEPPKKRAKSSHSPSGTVASYTATAVISALLGGLGTIAVLAALPAEYFQ